MAWYALYKWFVGFRIKPFTYWNRWYSQYLYDKWFDSLSDDEKEIVILEKKRKEEEEHRRLMNILGCFSIIPSILGDNYYMRTGDDFKY